MVQMRLMKLLLVFGHKDKNCDTGTRGKVKLITSHPAGNVLTVLKQFSHNQKHEPHSGTKGKVRGSQKSKGFISWAPWMSVQNVMSSF